MATPSYGTRQTGDCGSAKFKAMDETMVSTSDDCSALSCCLASSVGFDTIPVWFTSFVVLFACCEPTY